jgi:hypothetical protein
LIGRVHLAIFFAEHRPGLALLPPHKLASFRAADVRYRDSGAGYFTSLYDRLLDGHGQVAGVVLWCLPEEAGLGTALSAMDLALRLYLVPVHPSPPVYEVRFRDLTPEDAERLDGGGEQAFGGQIFRGDDGELAITIDLGYLFGEREEAERDLNSVRAASAHWPAITEAIGASAA